MAGIRLAGLWTKKDRNGREFLEGQLGGGLVRLYFSETKQGPNSPDASLYVVEKAKPQGQQTQQGGQGQPRGQHPYAPRPPQQRTQQAPPQAAWDPEDPNSQGFE